MTDFSLPIVLARETAYALGPVTVRPSTREVVTPGGTEVLEPRVMQVLDRAAPGGRRDRVAR